VRSKELYLELKRWFVGKFIMWLKARKTKNCLFFGHYKFKSDSNTNPPNQNVSKHRQNIFIVIFIVAPCILFHYFNKTN
jgi:hypothetical protein